MFRIAFALIAVLLPTVAVAKPAKITISCGSDLSKSVCDDLRAKAPAACVAATSEGCQPLCDLLAVPSMEITFSRGSIRVRASYTGDVAQRLGLDKLSFEWFGAEAQPEAVQGYAFIEKGIQVIGAVGCFVRRLDDVFIKYLLTRFIERAGDAEIVLSGKGGTEIEYTTSPHGDPPIKVARVKVDGNLVFPQDQAFPEAFNKARANTRR